MIFLTQPTQFYSWLKYLKLLHISKYSYNLFLFSSFTAERSPDYFSSLQCMQPVCHILFLTTISNGFLMLESLNLNMQFPLSLELRQSRVDGRSCVPLIFNCFKYNGHLGHVSTHIYVYRHVVNVALISSLMSLHSFQKGC